MSPEQKITTCAWHAQPSTLLRYVIYRVEGCEILVGSRPCVSRDFVRGCTVEFFSSVDCWVSVTDRLLPFPADAHYLWHPWDERQTVNASHLFGVLLSLRERIRGGARRIYLFCDAGTHRSPTVFGAFLKTFYPEEARAVVSARESFYRAEASCPLEYIESYIQRNAWLPGFLGKLRHVEHEDALFNILDQ